MPYTKAVLTAADNLFGKADLASAATVRGGATPYPLVIDPLVDGNSGYQSEATRAMERQIVGLLKTNYPNFELRPFTTTTLARGPLLFIGTFTAVDKDRKNVGAREQYRICLALVDLRTGKIVSKGLAFAEHRERRHHAAAVLPGQRRRGRPMPRPRATCAPARARGPAIRSTRRTGTASCRRR